MTTPTSLRIVFFTGVILMLAGVLGAALTYREMRAQRLLQETVHLLRFDPSAPSSWMTAPLPLYQNGRHAVLLALSAPGNAAAAGTFHGAIVVTVENPQGSTVMNVKAASFGEGIPRPDRVWWFPLDTLVVGKIASSEWKMQARVLTGDPGAAGSLGEIVVIPPGQDEFTPYLQSNAYKLYGAGLCIVLGFLIFLIGGRRKGSAG